MPDQTTLKSRLDALDELRSVAATPGGIVAGVPGGAVSLLAWWLREATGRTVLLVGTEPESLYRDCAVWGGEAGLALFAAADTLPFDRVAPGEEVIRRRLATLSLLSAGGPALVVAVPAARELDLSLAAVSRALEAIGALDLTACREEIRETWARDRERLALGAYGEGVDLFFPYLAGEPAPTLFDHLGDAIIVLAGGRERLWRAAERHLLESEGLHAQEEERGELPGGARSGLIGLPVLEAAITERPVVEAIRE